MKKIIFLLIFVFATYSCGNKSEKSKDADAGVNSYSKTNPDSEVLIDETVDASSGDSNPKLNDLLNMSKGLLEGSEKNKEEGIQFDTASLLDMLEQSGVSREEMEKLINNPDSLKVLAQQAIKDRQKTQENEPVLKR